MSIVSNNYVTWTITCPQLLMLPEASRSPISRLLQILRVLLTTLLPAGLAVREWASSCSWGGCYSSSSGAIPTQPLPPPSASISSLTSSEAAGVAASGSAAKQSPST